MVESLISHVHEITPFEKAGDCAPFAVVIPASTPVTPKNTAVIQNNTAVIPAKAGIHGRTKRKNWIPAFAGMTVRVDTGMTCGESAGVLTTAARRMGFPLSPKTKGATWSLPSSHLRPSRAIARQAHHTETVRSEGARYCLWYGNPCLMQVPRKRVTGRRFEAI